MNEKWFQDKDKFIELGGEIKEKIVCLLTAILEGDKDTFDKIYHSMKGNIYFNINFIPEGVRFFLYAPTYSVYLNTIPVEPIVKAYYDGDLDDDTEKGIILSTLEERSSYTIPIKERTGIDVDK